MTKIDISYHPYDWIIEKIILKINLVNRERVSLSRGVLLPEFSILTCKMNFKFFNIFFLRLEMIYLNIRTVKLLKKSF